MSTSSAVADQTPQTQNKIIKTRYYTLTFKNKAGSRVETKHFEFRGIHPEAIKEGRRHCSAMGLVFIHVQPFIVNLRHQEFVKFNNPDILIDGIEPEVPEDFDDSKIPTHPPIPPAA